MASNSSVPEAEAMRAAQSRRILDHLENWIAGAPGRALHITQPAPGDWIVTLDEQHIGHGDSLRDAAGQIAQVIALDGAV